MSRTDRSSKRKPPKRKKVLVVLGTRPETIKFAPVIRELKADPDRFETVVCATAQHREMLDEFMSVFRIRPDHDLGLMRPRQTLAALTARAVQGLDAVMKRERPDVVLVQGDTTTAFCGALSAFYHKIKVGHVEAGLRTADKYAPFPEEINRRLASQLADFHFAPTEKAKQALLAEGHPASRIHVTGNTVIDALLWMRKEVRRRPPRLPKGLTAAMRGKKLVLVTGHRRESFGEGFRNICEAILETAEAFPNVLFVYPVHLNPNVQEPVRAILGGHPGIILIDPLSYAPFVWLMSRSTLVLTDSGGVQEEAPSLGKPVLVMRDTTERPEGIAAGNALLVGTRKDGIIFHLADLLKNPERHAAMASVHNPYGDGRAARRIAAVLRREL